MAERPAQGITPDGACVFWRASLLTYSAERVTVRTASVSPVLLPPGSAK